MERILLGVIVVSGTVPLTAAECHCNTTDACTVFPSAPCSQVGSPDRCLEGWFGAYCQEQNIALGMSAVQSSTYSESSEEINGTRYEFPAGLGVDGRTTTEFYDEPFTCTHTGQSSDQHYWRLSLNTKDKIEHLKLYLRNHTQSQHRDNGMEILVGSQMCYNWSSTEHPPPIADVTCRQPLTGNTVTIRVPGGFDKHLTLCEVQIFVCSDGWFGTDCDKQCRCLKNTEVCDKNTGQCLGGCASGYTGIGCQTICSDGWFGTDCNKQCGCLNNTEVCDKITGQCMGGCAPRNSGMDREITVTEEVSNWGLPVAITLGTLLIFTVIAATIYIKRLMKQLEDSKTMMSEEHYVGLDERTTDHVLGNTYEQCENVSPYHITVN